MISEKTHDPQLPLTPMTLEGCVVRMADTISYIGRDIEDAIRLGLIQRNDIPQACRQVLGESNGTIVWRLVTDMIRCSEGKDAITFSPEISEAVERLKAFNLERIYLNVKIKRHSQAIRRMFAYLFETCLSDLEHSHHDSLIFRSYLRNKAPGYLEHHNPAEIVRDFISGMTDSYFLRQCPEAMKADVIATPIP
jgi:dGTPase